MYATSFSFLFILFFFHSDFDSLLVLIFFFASFISFFNFYLFIPFFIFFLYLFYFSLCSPSLNRILAAATTISILI